MDGSEVAKRINALLKERHIKKADFYDACEITSASFSQWNIGRTFPSRPALRRIAEYLDVSVDYLVTGDSIKKEPAPDISESRQELIRRLLNGEISEDTAELLLQIVDKTK